MSKTLGIGISLLAWMALSAACGDDAPRTSFHVSGTIAGLTSAGLVIENNGGDDDTIAINATSFQFPTELDLGSSYQVTVLTQPAGLLCTVTNGSGSGVIADVGAIVITCAAPTVTYSVTPSGTNVSITPDSAQVVASGATQAFTVTPDGGFALSNTVGGSCPAGTWSEMTYTTGAIAADCTVNFIATQDTFTVTPSADDNLMVEPFAPQTVADGSTQAFTLLANVGYAVSQVVGGTCPQGSWIDDVYTTGPITAACTVSFASTPANTTLSANVSSLTLATSGAARTITITNTGHAPTNALQAEFPTFPSGTTADFSTCVGDIAPNDSCQLTITPGSTMNSLPLTITIGGVNTNVIEANVNIVTFGSVYQGGFIFAIDDTTSTAGSIGGSVLASGDNGTAVSWGALGVVTNASSLTDGASNSAVIVSTLGGGNYAAEQCSDFSIDDSGNSPCFTGTCFSSWYLPSICEMSNSSTDGDCATGIPNIIDNLDLLIDGCSGSACLAGNLYWSSTETNANPSDDALVVSFGADGQSFLASFIKGTTTHVRCARAISP